MFNYVLPLLKCLNLLEDCFLPAHAVCIVQLKLSLFTRLLCDGEPLGAACNTHAVTVDSLSFHSSRQYVNKRRLAKNAVFVFSFLITVFCLVPCGRLSWQFVSFCLLVSFLNAEGRT